MTAATPPAEGAEAWAKQRAGAQAELKKASRRHAQLEDELSQIQQALTQSKRIPIPSPGPNPNSAPGQPLSYAKRGRPEIKLSLTTRAVRNDAKKTAEFWLVSESNGPWQLCASTSKPGGSPDQVGLWLEFSAGDTDPVVTPLRCILEAQAGREALLLTREMQLQRVFTALAAEEVKKASAKREAARMTAATPPAEGAEAWAKQRAGAQAELKKASRRHAQLEDELSQIQQALTQSKRIPIPSPDPNPNPHPDH